MKFIPILLLIASLYAPAAHAQQYATDAGKAAFTGEIPVNRFTGISESLSGRVSLIDRSVRFTLDLNTLDTGIGKRDRDMRKTLNTSRFPEAVFEGRLVSEFDPGIPEMQPARVQGTFTLHGVSQEIEVEGGLQRVGEGLMVTAEWVLNMRDYRIEPPRMLVMRVAETIDVRIEALLASVNVP
ncbi:MAG: YceI family protein [Rhodothermales bacterium]